MGIGMLDGWTTAMEGWAGTWSPALFIGLFLVASMLIIWRLECLSARGVEGTVLGTLVMPYASGLGNLMFVFIMLRSNGSGEEVVTNCIVNNVTNLTLLLGLPALIFGLNIMPDKGAKKKERQAGQINRISLLLTLLAGAFFTAILWVLGRDGSLSLQDGLVLVALFLFWQVFHVFEVMKSNVAKGQSTSPMVILDGILILLGAVLLYYSTEWIVDWLLGMESGFFSKSNIGWLTGWLMVLPNAIMAFYYAARGRGDISASSQIGDGHICIPLCIGLYCLFRNSGLPQVFETSIYVMLVAFGLHFALIATVGRIPRVIGGILVAAYGYFLWSGLV